MIKLLLCIFILQSNAYATFNRVWVGYKRSDVTSRDFVLGLNKVFFPKILEIGAGKGLVAFQPHVSKMKGSLPDEVALVTYKDEEAYKAIRGSKGGEEYSALHWDYFVKGSSESIVTVAYAGLVDMDVAYELRPDYVEWQKGMTIVTFYEAPADLKLVVPEIDRLTKMKDVNNSVFLVKGKWLLEYRSMKPGTKMQKLKFKIIEKAKLKETNFKF